MAFTSTVEKRMIFGNMRVHIGTYKSAGGSTGGNINTGLRHCWFIKLQKSGDAVGANANSVNENKAQTGSLPMDGSAVTIVTDANEGGLFMAIGK